MVVNGAKRQCDSPLRIKDIAEHITLPGKWRYARGFRFVDGLYAATIILPVAY